MTRRSRIALLSALLVMAAAVGYASATAYGASHAAPKATHITVTMTEFKFKLTKASAPKGTVTFKVVNKGKVPHDFKVNGKKSALVSPGKSATLKVSFTKAGKYPYLCTVPGYAASGMKGTFTVK